MAGAKKTKYQDFHTGGQGEVGDGCVSGGCGPKDNNQVVPGRTMVNRVPEDAHRFDENFSSATSEGEK